MLKLSNTTHNVIRVAYASHFRPVLARVGYAPQIRPVHSLQLARLGHAPQIRQAHSDSKPLSNSDNSEPMPDNAESKSDNAKPDSNKTNFLRSLFASLRSLFASKPKIPWSKLISGAISAEIFYECIFGVMNERSLYKTVEHGTNLESGTDATTTIRRQSLVDDLKTILQPEAYHSSYHTIVGEHGTGKSTVIKEAAGECRNGVIYVAIPDATENFGKAFAKALGWSFREEHTIMSALGRKLFTTVDSEEPKALRALEAFARAAERYKAKHGKPPVLILDDISKLGKEYPKLLEILQDSAKSNADDSNYIVVFVSGEGRIPRMMMLRSSWSRAGRSVVIGDVTKEEALDYLTKLGKKGDAKEDTKLGIKKEDAEALYELVGGRMRHLKLYGENLKQGQKFEDIRQDALNDTKESFEEADMARSSDRNFDVGKPVILEVLKEGTIKYDRFRELVPDKNIADELLRYNVFSYNPVKKTVTFQSRLAEVYVKENLQTYTEKGELGRM